MPYADKEQMKEYRRNYQREKRREWRVWVLKFLGGRCVVCGSEDALEIHHRDPSEKLFSLAQAWCHRKDKQLAELAKCELRCRDHHHAAHTGEYGHGEYARYGQGCRCEACKESRRAYNAQWMSRWRANGKDKAKNNYLGRG